MGEGSGAVKGRASLLNNRRSARGYPTSVGYSAPIKESVRTLRMAHVSDRALRNESPGDPFLKSDKNRSAKLATLKI